MKHFNLIDPPARRRIEVTTFQDKCRVFIEPDGTTSYELFEPCFIETSLGGDPVDYRRVVDRSWWQALKDMVKAAW